MSTNFLIPPGVTYPEPGFFSVIAEMTPFAIVAVAAAPLPAGFPVGSVMTTLGALV